MNIAIVGSRNFNDSCLIEECIKKKMPGINYIITGGAMGADTLAEKTAKKFKIPILIIKPEWNKYGKNAGLIRNKEIIRKADRIIAFWDGKSKGTKNSIELSMKYKKNLEIIYI